MAYSQKQKTKIINTICERIENGESLRSVCDDKDIIPRITFFEWLDEDKEKTNQYIRATESRADKIFEEILVIADTPQMGIRTKITEKGTETIKGDMIEHRRLQVDARKWILAKMMPKKYGDKIDHDFNIHEVKEVKTVKASEYIAEMEVSKKAS